MEQETGHDFVAVRSELKMLVATWRLRFSDLDEETVCAQVGRRNRSIKQILGHLVDVAANAHQVLVRMQLCQCSSAFPDFRDEHDAWIAVQHYQEADFTVLVNLWCAYNQHLCHVIKHLSPQCLCHTWKDADGRPLTLPTVVDRYLWHVNLHLGEIQQILEECGATGSSSSLLDRIMSF